MATESQESTCGWHDGDEDENSVSNNSFMYFYGASGGVMVSKLDSQTYTNEFEAQFVRLSAIS